MHYLRQKRLIFASIQYKYILLSTTTYLLVTWLALDAIDEVRVRIPSHHFISSSVANSSAPAPATMAMCSISSSERRFDRDEFGLAATLVGAAAETFMIPLASISKVTSM